MDQSIGSPWTWSIVGVCELGGQCFWVTLSQVRYFHFLVVGRLRFQLGKGEPGHTLIVSNSDPADEY